MEKKQTTLHSFLQSSSTQGQQPKNISGQKSQPKLKRNYADIVAKLIEEAQKKMAIKVSSHQKEGNFSKSYADYTEEQKAAILALTPYLKLSEISELFDVPVNTVKYWQKHGIKDKRKENSGRKPPLQDLEKTLYQYFLDLRQLGRPVNNHILRKKMMELYAKDQGIEVKQLELAQRFQRTANALHLDSDTNIDKENMFTPAEAKELREVILKLGHQIRLLSEKWLLNFRSRFGVKYRRITHIAKQMPENELERVDDFLKKVFFLRVINEYEPEMIVNFDETPIFYDTLPAYTYESVGVKNVSVKTSNLHKKRITLGVGVAASGESLKPLIIFHGEPESKFRNLKNPEQFLIKKNKNAWVNEELFSEWIKTVLIPYVKKKRQLLEKPEARVLFVIDSFSGHFGDPEELCYQNKIDLIFIPPGTTSLAQPLDLTLNKK